MNGGARRAALTPPALNSGTLSLCEGEGGEQRLAGIVSPSPELPHRERGPGREAGPCPEAQTP